MREVEGNKLKARENKNKKNLTNKQAHLLFEKNRISEIQYLAGSVNDYKSRWLASTISKWKKKGMMWRPFMPFSFVRELKKSPITEKVRIFLCKKKKEVSSHKIL